MPASFRSYLSNLRIQWSVFGYPSFNNQSIEAWPKDRVEKISNSIDTLKSFLKKKEIFLQHQYYQKA